VDRQKHATMPAYLLSGVGVGSANFRFHLVFLPAACFLPGERFSVVAVVAWIAAIERRIVNLLPYPSFSWRNWRSAVGAVVHAADDHIVLLKNDYSNETRFSLQRMDPNVKKVSRVRHLSAKTGATRRMRRSMALRRA
jgi:hypothetical protein